MIPDKAKILFEIAGVSLGVSMIAAAIAYFNLSKSDRVPVALTILGMGLMCGAFFPQLTENAIMKSEATNNVLAVFLILTACGVLLRIPALRAQLGSSKTSKQGPILTYAITIASLIPLIAHNVWQWQGAIYDTHKAIIAKDILIVSAPITSLVSLAAIVWLFSVKR